jgi:hypothetical protein
MVFISGQMIVWNSSSGSTYVTAPPESSYASLALLAGRCVLRLQGQLGYPSPMTEVSTTCSSPKFFEDPPQVPQNSWCGNGKVARVFARNSSPMRDLLFRRMIMRERHVPVDRWAPFNVQLTFAQTSYHFHINFDDVRRQLFTRGREAKYLFCWLFELKINPIPN